MLDRDAESGASDEVARRLGAMAWMFEEDWPWSIGIIGIQQTMTDMDCPTGSGMNGTSCFARLLTRQFTKVRSHASAAAAIGRIHSLKWWPIELGIIAGGWRIRSTTSWIIGRDKLPAEWLTSLFGGKRGTIRYLQEAELAQDRSERVLRFYTTHLSHNFADKNRDDYRHAQVQAIRAIVLGRVGAGELPPIVVGDFNFGADNPENTMSLDFELGHTSGIDQIWLGRKKSFPQTTGGYAKVWESIVILNQAMSHDGVTFPRLAGSHNSPGIGLHISA